MPSSASLCAGALTRVKPSYGCCDPGAAALDAAPSQPFAAAPQLYGMLFSSLEPGNGLFSMVIDATTVSERPRARRRRSLLACSTRRRPQGDYDEFASPLFPTGQETPRTFAFDAAQQRFVIATTNWSTIYDGVPRPVTLWSIDPTTGNTQQSVVPGVSGQVTGFAYVRALRALVVGLADLVSGWLAIAHYAPQRVVNAAGAQRHCAHGLSLLRDDDAKRSRVGKAAGETAKQTKKREKNYYFFSTTATRRAPVRM